MNLPNNATKDDVSNVFKKLYESGCKGGTVYRDGSRKVQVLNRQEAADQQSIKELPYKRLGATVSMKTPSGTAHITMNHDDSGEPFEVFVEIGKAGSSIKAMAEGIGRLISLIFRLEPIPPKERALQVIEQLSGIGGAQSVGFGKNKVLSLPDAVSKALSKHYELQLSTEGVSGTGRFVPGEGEQACSHRNDNHEGVVSTHRTRQAGLSPQITTASHAKDAASRANNLSADICPVCGQSSLIREEGCTHCRACGFSEC